MGQHSSHKPTEAACEPHRRISYCSSPYEPPLWRDWEMRHNATRDAARRDADATRRRRDAGNATQPATRRNATRHGGARDAVSHFPTLPWNGVLPKIPPPCRTRHIRHFLPNSCVAILNSRHSCAHYGCDTRKSCVGPVSHSLGRRRRRRWRRARRRLGVPEVRRQRQGFPLVRH
jgi:hypothetical protein